MKHISTLLLILITLCSSYGQNSYSIDWSVGTQFLATPGSNTNPDIHAEVTGRKMFSNIFGVQATYQYDELDSNIPNLYNTKVHSGYIGPVVNVGRWMQFEDFTHTWTFLANVGVGASIYASNINPDQATFDIAGGISILKKIGDNVSIRLNWTRVASMNQTYAFDGEQWIMSDITDSYRDGFGIGAVFNIGGSKDNRDWYLEPEITYTETDLGKKAPKEDFPVVINEYNCNECEDDKVFIGYMYFEEGKDDITGYYNWEVLRAGMEFIQDHQDYKIWFDGFACGGHGTEAFNCNISQSRADKTKKLFKTECNHRSLMVPMQAKGNCVDEEFNHIGVNKRVRIIIKPYTR